LCIVGTCFDTTATNTGGIQGTAVAVEKHLGRKLLYLACRHHVHELVLREVWEMLFGKDQGPTYTPFKNLQSTWDKLDKTSKTSFSILPVNRSTMQDQRKKMCCLLMDIVTGHAEKVLLPRDEYKELIELSLLFWEKSHLLDSFSENLVAYTRLVGWQWEYMA
jgi:hypothetical protein